MVNRLEKVGLQIEYLASIACTMSKAAEEDVLTKGETINAFFALFDNLDMIDKEIDTIVSDMMKKKA